MSLFIRECVGGITVMSAKNYKRKSVKNLNESFTGCSVKIKKGSLMQNIEGIHVGPTRNFTWYTESALLSSKKSWTSPYLRPLIMHHNETDGKIIGRIHEAEYVTVNTRSGTPALRFLCNIPDKDGIEQIQDGRLNTTSIGVIAHDVRCSICDEQVEIDENGNSECGHDRGTEYDNKTCYWMIYSMEAKELSYVIVPSDIYAHNLDSWIEGEESATHALAENLKGGKEKVKSEQIKKIQESLKNGTPITTAEGVTIGVNGDVANVNEPGQNEVKEGQREEGQGEGEEGKASKQEGSSEEGEGQKEESIPEEKQGQEDKVKELEDKVKELEALNSTQDKQLVDFKQIIVLAQEAISEVTKKSEGKDDLVNAAEEEALAAKGELRDYMEADLTSFQEMAEEAVSSKETLAIETKESLISKIVVLKEKVSAAKKKVVITEAVDTTLKRDNQFKEKIEENVDKGNKNSNVILEEALRDLFN